MSAPTASHEIVFLLDCDNTLLDNDRIQADMRHYFTLTFGAAGNARYWAIFDALRAQLGYTDYLGALQAYRLGAMDQPGVLTAAAWLMDYPFAERLYPQALAVLAHLRAWGPTVILSDGEAVFQPRKIARSGLWQAVEGRVLIYVHKETMLEQVARHYPARHYVMVDDKMPILAAMKASWGARLSTVFARQGHYALAPGLERFGAPDVRVNEIGDLLAHDLAGLSGAAAIGAA
ncbi:MAG: HAD family hydrolase [Pseudomonadota bacterium]